jgi:quercetin dioxygenase-like cupin family protein
MSRLENRSRIIHRSSVALGLTIRQEEENVIFVLNFGPGHKLPEHKHPGANVYVLVLEGTGTVTCNGTETVVSKGDIVHVVGDESFSYRSGDDTASSLYVVLTKTPSQQYAQNI